MEPCLQSIGRRCFMMLGLLSAAVCFAADPVSQPKIELLTLHSKVFSNTRTIRVWLPPGYYDLSQAKTTYPVFYFAVGLAGASYGAAISIYTVLERPHEYRWLLL